ncbi:MAG: cation:proton antiporter [Marinifilaceae bacterium]
MILLTIADLTLPIANPVIKFLIILSIILFAPLILNKFKIPHILGLIIAGAIIGPNGFNLILRDSSIILSGTAGLLYIMFLAGLEIDLSEFKRNSSKSLLFGLYTFIIPMALGTAVSLYVLEFSLMTSILLASMFASHTLIAYPIINKLGVTRNRAVTVTVGGTMITDTLALLVLAVVVGMTQDVVDSLFWTKLTISVLLMGAIILFVFPIIASFFFKNCSDSVAQYIFVLFMVFLGATLAELAGIEAIIGAFLAGLALNRLIPHSSPLMNRVEFIGNSIFIPFFLIGVGMLIDYRVFLSDWNTLFVALVMTVVATFSKYSAAYLAQKTFGYTKVERMLIFGLSNAQAAATLAAVLVGYNVILGETATGEPIRLLNDSILNGTIIMIFITCTIASICAQRGAHKLSMSSNISSKSKDKSDIEQMLIPLRNPKNVEQLIAFAYAINKYSNIHPLIVTNIIDNEYDEDKQLSASQKIFNKASEIASATDKQINTLLRYDTSFRNGVLNLVREHSVTDLLFELNTEEDLYLSSLDTMHKIIKESNINTFLYRSTQPIETVKRFILIIPPRAEDELGFPFWINKIWTLAKNSSSEIVVFSSNITRKVLEDINRNNPIEITFKTLSAYRDMLIFTKDMKPEDALIFVLSKRHNVSYDENMENIPSYINSYFKDRNILLIYPMQQNAKLGEISEMINPSASSALSQIEDITGNIIKYIKPKE